MAALQHFDGDGAWLQSVIYEILQVLEKQSWETGTVCLVAQKAAFLAHLCRFCFVTLLFAFSRVLNRSAKPDVLPGGAAKRALWRTCNYTVAREHVIYSGKWTCKIQWHLLAVATNVKLMNNPLAVATNGKLIKMRLVWRCDDCDEHIY